MKSFFDSSAFAKRYIADQKSQEIDELCAKASSLAVSIICLPEIISALSRLKRESKITPGQFNKGKQALLDDLSDAVICTLNQTVISHTIEVLESTLTRAMDALHIACALAWKAELFITSDQQQSIAANKIGLKVRLVQ